MRRRDIALKKSAVDESCSLGRRQSVRWKGKGLCSHIGFSPLWGPREGGAYVAMLISPPARGPLEHKGNVAILIFP